MPPHDNGHHRAGAQTLDIEFLLQGEGRASEWAAQAQPGDEVGPFTSAIRPGASAPIFRLPPPEIWRWRDPECSVDM